MTPVASKEVRLVARVSQDVQELVKNAAEMSGATLSQFIVDAVTAKATIVIEQARTIRLTLDGADRVFVHWTIQQRPTRNFWRLPEE